MPLIFSNPFDGRLTVGNVVANFRITDSGELAFPMGSRSRAMGLVEALEAQLNGGQINSGHAVGLPAPVPVVDAATSKPEEKHVEPASMVQPAAKRPRGRPPKARGALQVVTAESQPKKHAGKRRAE